MDYRHFYGGLMFVYENRPYHGFGKKFTNGLFTRTDNLADYTCLSYPNTVDWLTKYSRVDCYLTKWTYDTDNDYENNKINAYSGFYMDIDSDDLTDAYVATLKLYEYFAEEFKLKGEQLSVIYTGKKGFHLEICPIACGLFEPKMDLPLFYKWWAKQLAHKLKIDQELIDTRVYETRRMWRMERSIHGSTMEWCHRLPKKIFLKGLSHVKEYCTKDHDYQLFVKNNAMNPIADMKFNIAYDSFLEFKNKEKRTVVTNHMNIKKDKLPYCILSTMGKTIPSGKRNKVVYTVAKALFTLYNLEPSEIENIMIGWIAEWSQNLAPHKQTIRSACNAEYQFSCFKNSLLGELLDDGIANCPFYFKDSIKDTIRYRTVMCPVFAGGEMDYKEDSHISDIQNYIDELYGVLNICKLKDDWGSIRQLIRKIKEQKERLIEEWHMSIC